MSLPDDLLLNCLARVSRLYYPTLSLVSKSFRSLVASPELYEIRSSLGRTETCLYVCLKFYLDDPNPRWFTLCLKPTTLRKKKKKRSTGYVLAKIPFLHSLPPHRSGLVVIGSNIYNIGGNKKPSSNVSILDCRSNTWREAPNMQVKRMDTATNVFDGKIYVAGGCKCKNSSTWMEVFDPKTQVWEHVFGPLADRCIREVYKSAVIDGETMYVFGFNRGVSYKFKEEKWEALGATTWLDLEWIWLTYCVIDNILYCYKNRDGIKWYDSKIGRWIRLMGLKGLPKFADYSRVKLTDYGGKLVVLWDKCLPCYQNMMIWCAVISLEKRSIQEDMWGNVEWLDAVLKVPKSYLYKGALSVTL